MMKKTWTEDDVVCDAIGDMTFQAACDWFNENLHKDFQTTRASVYNWVVGANKPDHRFLNALVIFYAEGDPRRVMAETLLEMRKEAIRKVHAHWVSTQKKVVEA